MTKPLAKGVRAKPFAAVGGAPTQEVGVPVKLTVAEPGTGRSPSVTSTAVYTTVSLTPFRAVN